MFVHQSGLGRFHDKFDLRWFLVYVYIKVCTLSRFSDLPASVTTYAVPELGLARPVQNALRAGASSARRALLRALSWGPRLALNDKPTKPNQPNGPRFKPSFRLVTSRLTVIFGVKSVSQFAHLMPSQAFGAPN